MNQHITWELIRRAMDYGAAIEADTQRTGRSQAEHLACMDARARGLVRRQGCDDREWEPQPHDKVLVEADVVRVSGHMQDRMYITIPFADSPVQHYPFEVLIASVHPFHRPSLMLTPTHKTKGA